jgi:hypothetical protein
VSLLLGCVMTLDGLVHLFMNGRVLCDEPNGAPSGLPGSATATCLMCILVADEVDEIIRRFGGRCETR